MIFLASSFHLQAVLSWWCVWKLFATLRNISPKSLTVLMDQDFSSRVIQTILCNIQESLVYSSLWQVTTDMWQVTHNMRHVTFFLLFFFLFGIAKSSQANGKRIQNQLQNRLFFKALRRFCQTMQTGCTAKT